MEEQIQPQQKESIKLSKMSKGYNWEIKLHLDSSDALDLARLEKLNTELKRRYGQDDNSGNN